MTSVHFKFQTPQGTPKTGRLHITPIRRYIDGVAVIPTVGFDVDLDDDGTKTVQLTPTDGTYAWRVTEFPNEQECAWVRNVQVPESQSTVEYTALIDVDPATLIPTTIGSPLTELTDEDIDWISQFVAAGTHLAN